MKKSTKEEKVSNLNTKYSNISAKKIKDVLSDLFYNKEQTEKRVIIQVFVIEDEHGNIVCPFLEEFDKAMEEELLKIDIGEKCPFFISDETTGGICVNCGKHQSGHINYK